MARSKYKVANMDEEAPKKTSDRYAKAEADMTIDMGNTQVEEVVEQETLPEAGAVVETIKTAKKTHIRSKRYQEARGRIDRTKAYPVFDAITMLKGLSHAKFDESVEVHLVAKDAFGNIEVAYPHSTGKVLRVEIFSEDLLPKLDKGTLDFDVLLASPAQMGKLTKYARVLGPKGLMPNPKNGTLIADPEKRKKELASGKQSVRSEKKAPLVHTIVGKLSMPTESLAENIQALINACGQGKVLKATICSSMSPGIRVNL